MTSTPLPGAVDGGSTMTVSSRFFVGHESVDSSSSSSLWNTRLKFPVRDRNSNIIYGSNLRVCVCVCVECSNALLRVGILSMQLYASFNCSLNARYMYYRYLRHTVALNEYIELTAFQGDHRSDIFSPWNEGEERKRERERGRKRNRERVP